MANPVLSKGVTGVYIQWKGTEVCMDMDCPACEGNFHLDGEFCYYIQCPGCGVWLSMNGRADLEYEIVSEDECSDARCLGFSYTDRDGNEPKE